LPIAEISIVPVGTPSPSISSYITACYKTLGEGTGLKHDLTPMSTIVEGDLDSILGAVKKMHQVPFHEGLDRVVTTITIDDRRDKHVSMEQSVQAVTQDLH